MLVSLWSAKAGAGVSVTSALLALRVGRRDPHGVVLVDLGGDQPLVLGAPESPSEGLCDWLGESTRSPASLATRSVGVAPGLDLLRRGSGRWPDTDAVDEAVGVLAEHPSTVIVDAGCVVGDAPAGVGRRPVRSQGDQVDPGDAPVLPRTGSHT